MPPGIVSTIVKLAVISLVVGFVLSLFDITPANVLDSLGSTAQEVAAKLASFARWAAQYVLIGAVVVVPIWLVLFLLRRVRGR